LPLHERSRNLECVAPHELVDQLLANSLIRLAAERLREPLAESAAKLRQGRALSMFLGELVVGGRQHLLADAPKHQIEAHGLAGDGLIRVLLGKLYLDLVLLADFGADQRSLDLGR
jgi:hypothetical protein